LILLPKRGFCGFGGMVGTTIALIKGKVEEMPFYKSQWDLLENIILF